MRTKLSKILWTLSAVLSLVGTEVSAALVEFPTTTLVQFHNSFGKGQNFAQINHVVGLASTADFVGSWNTGDTLRWRVQAPSGFSIVVAATSPVTTIGDFQMTFFNGNSSEFIPGSAGTLTVENLVGTATIAPNSNGGVFQDGLVLFAGNPSLSSDTGFSFTALQFEFVAPASGTFGTYPATPVQIEWSAPTGADIGNLVTIEPISGQPIPEPVSSLFGVFIAAAVCGSRVGRRRASK